MDRIPPFFEAPHSKTAAAACVYVWTTHQQLRAWSLSVALRWVTQHAIAAAPSLQQQHLACSSSSSNFEVLLSSVAACGESCAATAARHGSCSHLPSTEARRSPAARRNTVLMSLPTASTPRQPLNQQGNWMLSAELHPYQLIQSGPYVWTEFVNRQHLPKRLSLQRLTGSGCWKPAGAQYTSSTSSCSGRRQQAGSPHCDHGWAPPGIHAVISTHISGRAVQSSNVCSSAIPASDFSSLDG